MRLLPLMFAMTVAVPSFGTGAATAPITAREAFVELPLEVLDILPRSRRLDMLDYFDVDSLWQAPNTLGGPSVLESVTDTSLTVNLTPVSRLQVCILPCTGKETANLVMTLYTIGADDDAPDTEINFLSPDMKAMYAKDFFRQPGLKDFLEVPKGSGMKSKDLEQAVAFPTVSYSFLPGNEPQLEGRLTVSPLLGEETRKLISSYLRPSLSWTWTGRKWQLKK